MKDAVKMTIPFARNIEGGRIHFIITAIRMAWRKELVIFMAPPAFLKFADLVTKCAYEVRLSAIQVQPDKGTD